MGEDTEALRQEVARLQGELARERARGEANRIAYEAALVDEAVGSEGAPAPLLYAWAANGSQVIRVRVGDREVAAALGPNWGDMHPGTIWETIRRIAGGEE